LVEIINEGGAVVFLNDVDDALIEFVLEREIALDAFSRNLSANS